MKLTAEHNKENHEISFEREGGRVVAHVDGRSYEVSVREVEDGLYLLMRDGDVYECLVERHRDRQDDFTVHVKNRTYETTMSDPRRLGSAHGSNAHVGDGSAEIASPMAGKVVRVLVELGAHVRTGDGIVVVEAMKMQNELKTPRDGVVAELRAMESATVNAGEVLAVVEGLHE